MAKTTKNDTMKSEIQSLFGQVHDAAQKAVTRIDELDARIVELNGERAELQRRTLSKAEFLAVMRGRVQGAGKDFESRLVNALNREDRSVLAAENTYLGTDLLCLATAVNSFSALHSAICYYHDDALMAGIDRALGRLEWPDQTDARPLAEIQARVAEIDAEIERLVEQRDDYIQILSSYEIVEG